MEGRSDTLNNPLEICAERLIIIVVVGIVRRLRFFLLFCYDGHYYSYCNGSVTCTALIYGTVERGWSTTHYSTIRERV
jgi:hypothetical protein